MSRGDFHSTTYHGQSVIKEGYPKGGDIGTRFCERREGKLSDSGA